MVLRFFLASGAAMLLLGECISIPDPRPGRLEVLATDISGTPVQIEELELFRSEPSRVAEITSHSSVNQVPYGAYRLRIYARGFKAVWRDIVVSQPETTVRVELTVGGIGCDSGYSSIGGTVRRDRSGGELWVKAVPIRGTGGGESRVGESGFFLISGLPPGSWLVLVMRDETILHSEVIKTFPANTDTSKLSFDVRQKR